MTHTTLERTNAPNKTSFIQLAECDQPNAALQQAEQELAKSPAEQIISQLDELAALYEDRIIHDRYVHEDATHDFLVFGTRTHDGSELEEIYTIHDAYSPSYKDYQQRSYHVTVIDHERGDYRISVAPTMEVIVLAMRNGQQALVTGEEAGTYLFDFHHRSLEATTRTLQRSESDTAAANLDAYNKLMDHSFAERQMPEAKNHRLRLASQLEQAA